MVLHLVITPGCALGNTLDVGVLVFKPGLAAYKTIDWHAMLYYCASPHVHLFFFMAELCCALSVSRAIRIYYKDLGKSI